MCSILQTAQEIHSAEGMNAYIRLRPFRSADPELQTRLIRDKEGIIRAGVFWYEPEVSDAAGKPIWGLHHRKISSSSIYGERNYLLAKAQELWIKQARHEYRSMIYKKENDES